MAFLKMNVTESFYSNQRWKKLDLILGLEILVLFLRATQFLISVKILPQKN